MARKAQNKFEEKANELMAWGQLYQYVLGQLDCFKDVKHDEDGEIVKDENGNWVFEDPDTDSCNYAQWVAWKSIAKKLEETKF